MIASILGRLLRSRRAGRSKLAWNDPAVASAPESLRISSPAFANGQPMPREYGGPGLGKNVSPPLEIAGAPEGAATLAIVVQDPDAPLPLPFVHLIALDLDPVTTIAQGALKPGALSPAIFGKNTLIGSGYTGPRPVPGHGPHTYVFQVFALDRKLAPTGSPGLRAALKAMRGHVIARGRLEGTFERP